jgi:hypothetical protein
VPRKVTLLALWAVFAVASVSVGFAAASVVSDPFTDAGTSSEVPELAGSGDAPDTSESPSTGTPSPSATPSTTKAPGNGSATVKRGISTRGGYVSATCRDGLVSVGAAPAVWWQVDSYTPGRVREARVRLEPAHDANGRRVEVTASCRNGTPVFATEYDHGGEDSDSSGPGGGGSSGSADDASGSGPG